MEDNKLIADFMGADNLYDGMSDVRAKRIYNYHSSWDWLMPVVIEIKRTGGAYELIDQIDFALTCDCTLENVYKSVLEFIKTYNDE